MKRKRSRVSGGNSPRMESTVWLTYSQAAQYTGLSVGRLRNLVSAQQIPVYGPTRSRRFKAAMLDLWLTDRGAAMRKFSRRK